MDITGDSLPDLLITNSSGKVRWFERTSAGTLIDRGIINASGVELAAGSSARISKSPGAIGDLPSLVIADASGKIFFVKALLRGDFVVDGSNAVDEQDLAFFGDAWQAVEGSPLYKPQCNLNLTPDQSGRQVIDILDFAAFGDCYGKTR